MIWRLLKFLVILAIVAGLGLVAFSFVGPWLMPAEFAAPQQDVVVPVDLGF